jgi:2-polyprenyl-3-methyl-5-hydroxy-6-metoxy-1,4-benzoquinol methylase
MIYKLTPQSQFREREEWQQMEQSYAEYLEERGKIWEQWQEIESMINGTQGYREEAEAFIQRSESIPFAEKHQHILHLIPSIPCSILDIGAGSGADVAVFAALGHKVVAVEPTDELRLAGMALHPSAQIEWGNDSLPDLAWTRKRGQRFDVVMITAVWMHLDEAERQQAMPKVTSLIQRGGRLIMSQRHGPVPPGRRMFEVSAAETIRLAQMQGLRCILNVEAESIQPGNRLAGITWSHLAFDLPEDSQTI